MRGWLILDRLEILAREISKFSGGESMEHHGQAVLVRLLALRNNLCSDSGIGKDLKEHAMLNISSDHMNFLHAVL
jgi:hypothetical protein